MADGVKPLHEQVKQLQEQLKEKDEKIKIFRKKFHQTRKKRDLEQQGEAYDSNANLLVGWILATTLALVVFAMVWDTIIASRTILGKWCALAVLLIYLTSSACLCCTISCKGACESESESETEAEAESVSGCRVVPICIMLAAFLTLGQFPVYFGLLAWGFPYAVEGKALADIRIAYEDPIALQTDMRTIAKDVEWTFERKTVYWDTAMQRFLGNSSVDLITPRIEHIGIVAHALPIVAAMMYQFGVGKQMGAGYGLAGIIIDFIDVQDFYLLLFENDIVVSYWSRPKELNDWWGEDVSIGSVPVKLDNGTSYVYSSKHREFEEWQVKDNSVFGANRIFEEWQLDTSGEYYKYWMWRYIFNFYLASAIYVTVWPWLVVVVSPCIGKGGKSAWLRTFMLACQTLLSLSLIEFPFLILRLACSNNYRIVMSSLILKNLLSIAVESSKLVIYLCGLKLAEKDVQSRRNRQDKICTCRSCCDHFLLRVLTLGRIIGFDLEEEGLYDYEPLCGCRDDEVSDTEHERELLEDTEDGNEDLDDEISELYY